MEYKKPLFLKHCNDLETGANRYEYTAFLGLLFYDSLFK